MINFGHFNGNVEGLSTIRTLEGEIGLNRMFGLTNV